MKQWRTRGAQQQYRKDAEAMGVKRLPARLGRATKAAQFRIVPIPSFLLQRMLINIGLMQAG